MPNSLLVGIDVSSSDNRVRLLDSFRQQHFKVFRPQ